MDARLRHRRGQSTLGLGCLIGICALVLVGPASAETWRGLTVAPEHRCSPYDRKRDYPYPVPPLRW